MRHPTERFILIELIVLGLVAILGIIALIQASLVLILICLFLIVVSLLTDALVNFHNRNVPHSGKQLVRALFIFLFLVFFIFIL